jgi:hypothetical protein
MNITIDEYRRLRRIFLRAARSYRFGCAFGKADATKLKAEQNRMAAIRKALK